MTTSSAIGSFVIGSSPIEGTGTGADDVPGSATTYLRQKVLGHTLAFASYTPPTAIYIALTTVTPSASSPGFEVHAGNGYARQQAFYAMESGSTDFASNTATIEWPMATASWGTVGWFEIWDAPTGGNRLYWGPLVDPADGVTPITIPIAAGDIMRLPATSVPVQAI